MKKALVYDTEGRLLGDVSPGTARKIIKQKQGFPFIKEPFSIKVTDLDQALKNIEASNEVKAVQKND